MKCEIINEHEISYQAFNNTNDQNITVKKHSS